jgi:PAS domain S-box-containing protein
MLAQHDTWCRCIDSVEIKMMKDGIPEFNQFFDLSNDMMSYIRVDGFFNLVNPTWSLQFGWTQEEFLAIPIVEFLHPEDRSQISEALLRVTEGHKAITFENRFRCKDGAYKWIRWNAYFLSDQNCTFALTYDITASREAAEMLRVMREELETRLQQQTAEVKRLQYELFHSKRQFDILADSVKNCAVMLLDTDGRIVKWNAGAERVLGYSAKEIVGEYFSRFYPAEDIWHGKHHSALRAALANGQFEDEGLRLRKDGSHFHAHITLIPLEGESGTLRGFMKLICDRTKHKELEQQLSASEEQYRRLFEESLIGNYVSTPDGCIRACNVAYAKMFGFASIHDALQCNIADLSLHSDILQTVFQSLHAHKQIQHAEFQLRHRNGKTVDVVASAIGKFNDSGELMEVHGCFSDVTQKKLL